MAKKKSEETDQDEPKREGRHAKPSCPISHARQARDQEDLGAAQVEDGRWRHARAVAARVARHNACRLRGRVHGDGDQVDPQRVGGGVVGHGRQGARATRDGVGLVSETRR